MAWRGGERNKRQMWYAEYEGVDYLRDDSGRRTGAKTATYSDPVELWANISPAKGSADASPFGTGIEYDKTVLVFDIDTPIDENSRLWIDTAPVLDDSGATETPHDYVVVRRAEGLHSVSYAVKRVEVS